ncbi:MAG TPA: hypothetical protein VJ579_04400 [Candidatus Paceibacterota bacterium]|nr:hypothetical protein [Candidatus Paceibacterota bacterium]
MQQEQTPTINNEHHELLAQAIFGDELASLPPEHTAMFRAENDACFAYFVDSLPEAQQAERERAIQGDKDAMLSLTTHYHEFRDAFESELAQSNPDLYSDFIESVAMGDLYAASQIVHDFYKKKELANSAVIDDELDAQYI